MYYYKHFKNIEGFKRILSDTEINKFFDSIDDEMDYLFFHLMLIKGKRISELCSLNIRDLDLINNIMVTHVSKKRDENSRRITYIDEHTRIMILNYLTKWAIDIKYNNGFLFYSERRRGKYKSSDSFGAKFFKYRAKIGLDKLYYMSKDGRKIHHVRSHSLRATAINKILDVTQGDIFKTLAFSHHKTIEGLIPYKVEFEKRELAKIEDQAFKSLRTQTALTIFIE